MSLSAGFRVGVLHLISKSTVLPLFQGLCELCFIQSINPLFPPWPQTCHTHEHGNQRFSFLHKPKDLDMHQTHAEGCHMYVDPVSVDAPLLTLSWLFWVSYWAATCKGICSESGCVAVMQAHAVLFHVMFGSIPRPGEDIPLVELWLYTVSWLYIYSSEHIQTENYYTT